MTQKKDIKLDHISKIEGHAKLHAVVSDQKVEKADLEIFEGSRFFEGILKGERYDDLGPVSSRICGVCSVVHRLTSLRAVEDALDVEVTEQTKKLRELLNLAGTLQSHALHLYFMTLPDYYGFDNAIEMADEHKDKVERALRLKRFANSIVRGIGGREVHPFVSVLGGFGRIPDQDELDQILKKSERIEEDVFETMKLFSSLEYPEFELDHNYFSLSQGSYFYSGPEVSCFQGEEFKTKDLEDHVEEFFKQGNTAEFVTEKHEGNYMVGALSRIVVKGEELSDKSKKFRDKILERKNSPFMNIPAQAIEVYECLKKIQEILRDLEVKEEEPVDFEVSSGVGYGACEAPRGILFHKYELDDEGYCKSAEVITPTSQNLESLQENVRAYLSIIKEEKEEEIRSGLEELIRAYDPCISCSTHFLELELDRKT